MSRNYKRDVCVEVADDSEFDFGQKLFVVTAKKKGLKRFREKCPICGDTKEIELKGYKVKCPLCEGYRTDRGATVIELYGYEVTEYIINRFEVRGVDYKKAYSGDGLLDDRNLPKVTWYGFARWGNSDSATESRQFSAYEMMTHDPDKLDIRRNLSGCAFFSKTDATRFCKRLHERQKEKLDKFNAEHGTDHQYPFEF